MKTSTTLFLFVVALIISGAGYVRSDASDHLYKDEDNKVGPSETYKYFDLPFCVSEGVKDKKEVLAEVELQAEQNKVPAAAVATHTMTIGVIHPPPDIRTIVEKTAQFVSKNGLEFEKRIIASNANNAIFNFLSSSDPYHAFYQHKLTEYRAQNQDGVETTDTDGADPQLDTAAADDSKACDVKL